MEHRLAVAATSREGLQAALEAAAHGQPPAGGARGASTGSASKVVFVFPGQGSQWLGMSRQLAAQEPVFRAVLEECDRAIKAEAGWSLLAELAAEEAESQMGRIDVVQPMLFAMEVALAAQWRSWGVEPAAVVGHSMGEVAAAYVAGGLSLKDAVAIICRRSVLLRRISGQGEMAMVGLSIADAEAALLGYEDRLSVAVSNSPSSTVLSGEPAALSKVLAALEAKGVFCRRVKVDVASHSPQVDPLRDDIMAALSQLVPLETTVPMHSTVTAAPVAGPDLVASYWASNLRQPVRFAQVVRSLLESGHTLFVEMSPHPLLMASVEEIRQETGKNGASVGSLRRGRDERSSMLEALGGLWVQGYPVRWERQFPSGIGRVPLPTYAWQRERYWIDAPKQAQAGASAAVDGALWSAVEAGPEAVSALLALPEALHGSVDALLPHIAAWRERRDEDQAFARRLYDESWPLVAPPAPVAGAHKGTWLLVLPSPAECPSAEPIAAAIERALAEVGGQAERVEAASIVHEFTARLMAGVRGVISLTALDEAIAPEHPHTPRGLAHTLELAKRMPTAGRPTPLWIVTRGAVAVRPGEPVPAPLGALHAGFGRVFALEHAEQWGGHVDLPLDVDDAMARLLVASLGDVEDQIALRAEGRHVRRLERVTPSLHREPWQPTGTVLITGGTGALGAHVARMLAERGAPHLVLTSRRGSDAPGARALAEELEARGARVSLVACDTSDAAHLDQLFARFDAAPEAEALSAVFHTAGLLEDAIIANLPLEQLDRVLQPKVAAWAIHERLASRRSTARLVLFSSIAGFLGAMGQANYAASNAYLDALAQHRRALGLPAVSIQWGTWAGGGMVTADIEARTRRLGVQPLDPAGALRCLDLAMAEGRSLAVMDVDWARFVPSFAADRGRPLLLGVDEARAALEARAEESSRPAGTELGLRETLANLPDVERLEHLRSLVAAQAGRVLGIAGASSIDVERGFADMGLDSLMAVEAPPLPAGADGPRAAHDARLRSSLD